jgi:hypothetical protein
MNPLIQQLLNAARNTAVRAAKGFVVQADRNAGPQVRRALGVGYLNRYSNPIFSATKKDPSLINAAVKGSLSAPGAKPILAMPVGLLALDPRLTGAIEGGLNQVGPGLDRFFGAVTPKPVQDFGRSMEQYGWGAFNGFVPGEITAASVSTPERAKGTQAILNGKPVYWTGSKYGWQSGPSAAKAGLLGSEVVGDDVFAPVIGTTLTPPDAPILPPPQRGAADRAYQQEKDRVTQMTEQDPLFKKYQVAELTKAYNTASPEEKNKIGLQIWAATNPTLVKKVPAGQVGYQTSASMFGSQAFGTDVPGVTETSYSQIGQQGGVPGGVQFPGAEQATKMPVFSMGADAQQLGVTPPGTTPFPMIGKNVFKRGFEVPSSEDLSQTQLALLKRAFESRIK